MLTSLFRKPYAAVLWLSLLMIVTRNHAWTPLHHLPDASLAIFFLTGIQFRSRWSLSGFLLLAALIDALVLGSGAVSALCLTPAYTLLAPAYASAWLGGRWFATQGERSGPFPLLRLMGVLLIVALVAECLASGGFYFFGGYFAHPSLSGFAPRFIQYFPHTLLSLFVYTGLLLGVSHRFNARFNTSSHVL